MIALLVRVWQTKTCLQSSLMVQPWPSWYNPVLPATNHIVNFMKPNSTYVYTIRARLFSSPSCFTKTYMIISYESSANWVLSHLLPSFDIPYARIDTISALPPRHSQNVCTRIAIRTTKSIIRRISITAKECMAHNFHTTHQHAKQNKYANTVPAKHPIVLTMQVPKKP